MAETVALAVALSKTVAVAAAVFAGIPTGCAIREVKTLVIFHFLRLFCPLSSSGVESWDEEHGNKKNS